MTMWDGYKSPGCWDELLIDGQPRPGCQGVVRYCLQQGLGGLHDLIVAAYFQMEPSTETVLLPV